MPILALLSNWRLIAGGLAVAGLLVGWLYVSHLRATVAQQAHDLEVAGQINKENLATIEQIKADAAKSIAAVTSDAQNVQVRTETVEKIKEVVRNVPVPMDDKVQCHTVAPELRTALDGLRSLSDADGSQGGAADAAKGAADVRSVSGPAHQ